MGSLWSRDKVYLRAKSEGFRSRASYKLIEIQKKFSVIRNTDNIVDLGAAPGSWLQVERTLTNGRVLGVDLNPIAPLDGVETIEGDLTDPVDPGTGKNPARVRERGGLRRLAQTLRPEKL